MIFPCAAAILVFVGLSQTVVARPDVDLNGLLPVTTKRTTTSTTTVAPEQDGEGNDAVLGNYVDADTINEIFATGTGPARTVRGLSELVPLQNLTDVATRCARELVSTCRQIASDCDTNIGSNTADSGLYVQTACEYAEDLGLLQYFGLELDSTVGNPSLVASKVILKWLEEEANLGKTYREGTAHFSQIIWKATKNFGCAVSEQIITPRIARALVCVFDPPGNLRQAFSDSIFFEQNVLS